jgi:Coenzyme PQQ synthesis protein D (PqqD)
MHEYRSLPRARRDGLLEEAVGEELLLYDRGSHTAHCLSPVAAYVWRHCDGQRHVAELAELAGVSEDLVAGALRELREKDLLVAEPELMQSTVPGVSRREAIGRVGRYGAAAVAGSMIVSATAATPAMASSGEEILTGDYECGGTVTLNCCQCERACLYNTNQNEEYCAKYCKDNGYGDMVKFKAQSYCEKV